MIKKTEQTDERDLNDKYIQPTINKLKERSFSDYLDISIIVRIVVLFVAIVFAFLVDFIFDPDVDWKDIGVNTVIIAACTTSIYLLLRTYAMRKGRKTKAWTEAFTKLSARGRDIIDGDKAKHIAEYCRQWEKERLNSMIEAKIVPVGVSLNEFEEKYAKYTKEEIKANFPELSDYQYKIILQAKKIKRPKFDERYFYINAHSGNHRSPSSGLTSKQINGIATGRIVITTLVTSFISAALLRDIIIDFSAASIIRCFIKLAIIIFFGIIGLIGGYSFTAVRETSEMNAKSDEIDVFIKWCDNNK